jgi:hypothetical protein
MSSVVEIDYCGEGPVDAEVARRLILHAGANLGTDYLTPRRGRGKNSLDPRLKGLNAGARFRPVLVLRDLDHDEPCPGALVARLLPERAAGMCLRVAVRSAEAWLLADPDALTKAIGIRTERVPDTPETLPSPKTILIELLRSSPDRSLRRNLALDGEGAPNPQLLGEWLSGFVRGSWSPARAERTGRAPSLTRAVQRLRSLATSRLA